MRRIWCVLGGLVLTALVASAALAARGDTVSMALASGGSRKDGSWTQAWYEGSQKAAKALGSKIKVTFVDETNSVADYDRAAQAALAGGTNVWMFATAEVPQLVTKYAAQFPDRMIGGVEAPRATYPKNVFTVLPHFEEGTFRAGVIAGLTSKSKHIGVIGAFDFPILTSELEGFILGARYVNPGVKVSRVYINSFTDPAKAFTAAKAQVASGVDVIFSATDAANQGIYRAARQKKGTFVITQYFDTHKQAPDVILTSVIYNLQSVAQKIISLAANNKLEAKHYAFGLKDAGVGQLAPFHQNAGKVPAVAKTRLARVTSDIKSGRICIPGPGELGKSGSASEVDPVAAVKC